MNLISPTRVLNSILIMFMTTDSSVRTQRFFILQVELLTQQRTLLKKTVMYQIFYCKIILSLSIWNIPRIMYLGSPTFSSKHKVWDFFILNSILMMCLLALLIRFLKTFSNLSFANQDAYTLWVEAEFNSSIFLIIGTV